VIKSTKIAKKKEEYGRVRNIGNFGLFVLMISGISFLLFSGLIYSHALTIWPKCLPFVYHKNFEPPIHSFCGLKFEISRGR
jgi:hypothetical protein